MSPIKQISGGKLLLIVFITIATSIGTGLWMIEKEKEKTEVIVNVGDVWVNYKNGNPFTKEDERNRRVISVKFGYIQYIRNDKDTLSLSEAEFLIQSHRIKKGP